MQKVKWILLMIAIPVAFSFRPAEKEKITWITVQELNALYAKEPRPILVDLYTDWCGWCKEMDRTTYKNEKLAKYVNEHFYAVKYNAESTDSVSFNNKIFHYNKQYKTNEFALYLSFGQLEYPNTVFLSAIDARPAPLPGYMKPKQMEAPLKFFGGKEDAIKTFVEFNKQMKKEW